MAREPIVGIVKEFLRSDQSQIRKNALIALATIGTKESLSLVATTALNDTDKSVRDHATEEIARLELRESEPAISIIRDSLSQPGGQWRRAYETLSRLRNLGLDVHVPSVQLFARLRWAYSFRSHFPSQSSALALLKSGVTGTALGMALVAFVVIAGLGLKPTLQALTQMAVIVALVAPLTALLGAKLAAPVESYPDRGAAVLVECGIALFLGLIWAALLLGLEALVGPMMRAPHLGVLLLPSIAFSATRAGTFLGAGLVGGERNRHLEFVVSAALGTLVTTAAHFVLLQLDSFPDGISPDVIWAIIIPTNFALAAAYAGLDVLIVSRHRSSSVLGRGFSAITVLVLAAIVVSVVILATVDSGRRLVASSFEPRSLLSESEPHKSIVTGIPFAVPFHLSARQKIIAEVTDEGVDGDFAIAIYGNDGTCRAFEDDPPMVERILEAGDYWVVTDYYFELGACSSDLGLATFNISQFFPELLSLFESGSRGSLTSCTPQHCSTPRKSLGKDEQPTLTLQSKLGQRELSDLQNEASLEGQLR